jgi:hypothetical protein
MLKMKSRNGEKHNENNGMKTMAAKSGAGVANQ